MYFSKSKYVEYLKCAKSAWLSKYNPDAGAFSEDTQQRFAEGTAVGELAKPYFGHYEDATVFKADGQQDRALMVERTKQFLAEGVDNICEAAFSYKGLYCAVDILHREGDGHAIYEVKSTTQVKDTYIWDVAYQKYVLEQCGIRVTGAYILHVNGQYVRHGEIDLHGLFVKEDVGTAVCAHEATVAATLAKAEADLAKEEEPKQALCASCDGCKYLGYCTKDLPSPNIFDSTKCSINKKLKYFHDGVVTLDQYADRVEQETLEKHPLNDKAPQGIYYDKAAVRSFLDKLSYP
ncbi:MAG: Dna2/Cas4 domain-containing protein, partial [Clostridia bacterium]|nr:Dna2/Cas4 domain-containing protein [Clostridia bacterium]